MNFPRRPRGHRDEPGMAFQPASLELRKLTKRFGSTLAVDQVDFQVAPGEFVVILGPSGCGKSTLLSLIMGIVAQDSGEIAMSGHRIDTLPPEKRDMAMVFQSYALFPHMSVRDNIAFGLRMKKVERAERSRRIAHVVELCQLAQCADRLPHQLSGGQKQRAALARALVMQPALMLYDEPLSNLDAGIRGSLRTELRAINRHFGSTALLVTHDHEDAMILADRIIVMHRGGILESGTPEQLYRTPAHRLTAELLGAANLIQVDTADGMATLPWGERCPISPACRHKRGRQTAMLLPEDISLSTQGTPVGTIVASHFLGHSTRYEADIGPHRLRAASRRGEPALSQGERVALHVEGPLHLLEESDAPERAQ